jgi:hypothetical protein
MFHGFISLFLTLTILHLAYFFSFSKILFFYFFISLLENQQNKQNNEDGFIEKLLFLSIPFPRLSSRCLMGGLSKKSVGLKIVQL